MQITTLLVGGAAGFWLARRTGLLQNLLPASKAEGDGKKVMQESPSGGGTVEPTPQPPMQTRPEEPEEPEEPGGLEQCTDLDIATAEVASHFQPNGNAHEYGPTLNGPAGFY